MPRKRTSRPWIAGQLRNLQGAQYEMDAYNASSALHFVDAANITWVTTEVVGSIAPSGVPTADPTATPTTPPSPELHGRAHGHAHGPAHDAT